MDWNTSVQNLLNWADKGAMQLNKLIPALKKIALQDGANVNVDETWLRYHAYNKKRKTYMWCLVNRKARIVIFFYEDTTDDEGVQKHGGRSRNVLKEFLGDAKSNHFRATVTTYICILTMNLSMLSICVVWLMQELSSSMPTTKEACRQESSLS